MRILFATDGSAGASRAILTAAAILRTEDCEFAVVCVAPPYLPPMTGWDDSRLRSRYRHHVDEETRRILRQAQRALHQEGIEAQTISEFGAPGDVICRLAGEYNLVVVGAHGSGGERNTLGTTASYVLLHSTTPVLIGRELRSSGGLRILAAIDGSEASRNALRTMAETAALDRAEVVLMQVIETPWLHIGLEQEWFGFEDAEHPDPESQTPWREKLNDEAAKLLERARNEIPMHHLTVETRIEEGVPASVILAEAETGEYDLVVAGTTGATDLKHSMLGSVSASITRNAPCSVLVARR